jgi:ABC-2 type transport system permease protein
LTGAVGFDSTIFKDGVKYDGIKGAIVPGIFLVLFFLLISVFGNQMITSTTEEKENRVIEIILTTIKARTLIIGKILSLLVLAFVQLVVTIAPVLIAYFLLKDQLSIPNFDLSNIPINPIPIAISAIIFIFSFLLFTGLLVGIGAAAPTVQQASGSISIVMLAIFGPLYAVTLFISAPESPIVQFLTFFPLTAPIPLMLRNAVGNLSGLDTVLGISILAISAIIALSLAIRIFQYGALEYANRVSFKSILKKNK